MYLIVNMELVYVFSESELYQVCQWNTFKASCKANEVIEMTEAVYGRMHIGTCVTEDLGRLGYVYH